MAREQLAPEGGGENSLFTPYPSCATPSSTETNRHTPSRQIRVLDRLARIDRVPTPFYNHPNFQK